jgi:DNA-binding MarR family transcriptional regulator
MDITRRKIIKISREVNRFINLFLKGSGVGTSEYEYIHAVRKHPGITQAGVRELLGLDKGAAARRAANLEAKGFLIRKSNPDDKRSQFLFATEKADMLKNSRASIEARFFEWLLADLPDDKKEDFAETLSLIYLKCKAESKAGFIKVSRYVSNNND